MTDYVEPLTLWRGGLNLGEVVAHLPGSRKGEVFGLFRPTSAFQDIGKLMQHRVEQLPGTPVFISRFEGPPIPGPVNLRALSDKEAAGLPIDAQLLLRDGDGNTVDTSLIGLDHYDIPELAGPMPDLCRQHGFEKRAWLLSATLRRPEEG